MSDFKREERYHVMKLKDIGAALSLTEQLALAEMAKKVHQHRESVGKPELECVVVESGWPEYEHTWRMIEMRVAGDEKVMEVRTGGIEVTADFASLEARALMNLIATDDPMREVYALHALSGIIITAPPKSALHIPSMAQTFEPHYKKKGRTKFKRPGKA